MKRICGTCRGDGEIETGQTTSARCIDCLGTGELPQTALVRVVGGDGPLVTAGYARDLMTLALGFSYGWAEAQRRYPDDFTAWNGPQEVPYADLRDFLLSEVEADPLTAQRLALWVTRPGDAFFLGLGDLP